MIKKRGKSLCLFSGKGGVGKTIITLNLAGIFEILAKKVLIIDMDLTSGQISLALNKPTSKTIYSFADDILNNRFEKFSDYVTRYDDLIDIFACPKDPRQAAKIETKYLEMILDQAMNEYDVVLVDTNHNLSETNLSILDKVDEILFVMNNDPLDLKNIKNLVTIFNQLNKTNYKIMLNDSRDPLKKYFTIYDLNSILKSDINYYISDESYLQNMDQFIMNGEIVTLQPKAATTINKDFAVYTKIATEFLKKEDNKNE